VGFQARVRIFRALGPLGARWLWRGLVLHNKLGGLPHPTPGTPNTNARRVLRRPSESRLRARHMGIAGQQFLVGWRSHSRRHTKTGDPPNQLAPRSNGCFSRFQTPVTKSQLQRRHLHSVWRQLPECLRCVAILLAGETQIACPIAPLRQEWGRVTSAPPLAHLTRTNLILTAASTRAPVCPPWDRRPTAGSSLPKHEVTGTRWTASGRGGSRECYAALWGATLPSIQARNSL
jgi:hypothetical protein